MRPADRMAAGPFPPGSRPWLPLALGALLLLAAGCGSSSGEGAAAAEQAEPEEDAIAVEARPVERGSITSAYGTSATLRADKQATVIARTRGVVRELLVEEGDRVRADQPLARLENDEQRIEYEKSVTTRDNAWREYERAEKLHTQGLLSDEEFETSRREAEEAKQTAALNELVLSRTVIRAPFGGRILTRHLDVGATVADGTSVYDIADLDPLYADVNVPERQIAKLAVGQLVRLAADSSSIEAEARIERIAPLVDPATGTVKVTLAVGDTDDLRPGSFVRVAVVTEVHDDALVVPRSALVAEGRRWYLFRVNEDGVTVERLQVTRGFEERDRVEIADPEQDGPLLRQGDLIVVTGASALTEGARIRILDGEEPDSQDAAAEEDASEAGAGRVGT